MLTRLDFVAIAAVSNKSTCYSGYLKESEIRTSHSMVPSFYFSKAFDIIARLVMFPILRYYGVPDNVKKSRSLYSSTKSAVLVDGEMSGENRCPARRHPSSLPICHCFRLGTPQM